MFTIVWIAVMYWLELIRDEPWSCLLMSVICVLTDYYLILALSLRWG
jgi:hypothetical protein